MMPYSTSITLHKSTPNHLYFHRYLIMLVRMCGLLLSYPRKPLWINLIMMNYSGFKIYITPQLLIYLHHLGKINISNLQEIRADFDQVWTIFGYFKLFTRKPQTTSYIIKYLSVPHKNHCINGLFSQYNYYVQANVFTIPLLYEDTPMIKGLVIFHITKNKTRRKRYLEIPYLSLYRWNCSDTWI